MRRLADRGKKRGAGYGAKRANETDSHQTTTSEQEAEGTPAQKKLVVHDFTSHNNDLEIPADLQPRARQAAIPHRRLNWTHLPSPSVSRATDTFKMMRMSSSRTLVRTAATAAKPSTLSRAASAQAISNPTLANIEKRWEGMPPSEQAELWMALRDRQKDNWNELTLAEKKACE